MKNFTKLVLATASTVLLSLSVFAQQRQVEMAVSITEPTNNTTINPGANFTVKIKIQNNGPDQLNSGDTIFYQSNISQTVGSGTLTAAVPAGQSIELPITLTNSNRTGTDQNGQICFYIFDDPSTQIQVNNNPISISYIDNDSTNNGACVTLILKTGPTSIEDVEIAATSLNVYPNPATDHISFQYTANTSEDVVVAIYDILGREVYQSNLGKGAQGIEKTYSVNISHLNTGTFTMSVTNGNIRTMGKVVVK